MRMPRVAGVIGLALLIFSWAISGSVSAQAPVPNVPVGKAVGYGLNLDLTAFAAPFLNMIRNNPSLYNITSIQQLNFTGSYDAWFYEKLVDKTTTYYQFQERSASGLKARWLFNATFNNLPPPGTHAGTVSSGLCSFSSVPKETGTVEIDGDFTALVTNSGTSWYTVASYTLHNSTDQMKSVIRASLTLRHVPSVESNFTSCSEKVTYVNRALTLSVDTSEALRQLFTPSLDYLNFPINDGENWYANSSVTVGAALSGTIDLRGLTAQQEADFFKNVTNAYQSVPGLAVTGLDHFPIDLAAIHITAGGVAVLENGQLHDQTQNVTLHLQATQATMTLADGNFHTVYRISQYAPPGTCQPTLAAIYSPDDGMIIGIQLLSCSGTTPVPIAEWKNVPPDTAQSNIQKTETNYAPVAAAPSPLTDFFVRSPYLGFILVIVAVALVVAYIAIRRRKKPTMAAPPSPPGFEEPGPPPGPPPG